MNDASPSLTMAAFPEFKTLIKIYMKSNATVLLLSTTVYPALIAAVVVSIEPRSSVT